MSGFVGLVSAKLPDRRVLMTPYLSEGWSKVIVSDQSNADSGSDPTSLLRPGNVLLYDAATGKYFDDAVSGDPSAQASVTALQTADASWASKDVEVSKNGALEYANQRDPTGAAADVKVHAVGRGHFDESNLVNLTSDAKSVLLRRGSRFES